MFQLFRETSGTSCEVRECVCQILLELSEDLSFWKAWNYIRMDLCCHLNAVVKFRSARWESNKFVYHRKQGNSDNEAFSVNKPIHAGLTDIPFKKHLNHFQKYKIGKIIGVVQGKNE